MNDQCEGCIYNVDCESVLIVCIVCSRGYKKGSWEHDILDDLYKTEAIYD